MNNVNLIGNLTRDPDLRYSTGANQTAICKFSIAVNDGYGDKQQTSFIPITVFGKQAENCDRYLAKGRRVAITGRIQTGSYERDGRTVYTTDVIASHVEFLGGREPEQPVQQQMEHVPTPPTTGKTYEEVKAEVETRAMGFSALSDDDIPF